MTKIVVLGQDPRFNQTSWKQNKPYKQSWEENKKVVIVNEGDSIKVPLKVGFKKKYLERY